MYKRVRNEVVTNAKSSVTCRYIMFCVCVVCMHNVLRWQWAKICREYICITKLKFIKDTRQDKLQLQSIFVWPMIECQSCVVSFQFTLLYMCVCVCGRDMYWEKWTSKHKLCCILVVSHRQFCCYIYLCCVIKFTFYPSVQTRNIIKLHCFTIN